MLGGLELKFTSLFACDGFEKVERRVSSMSLEKETVWKLTKSSRVFESVVFEPGGNQPDRFVFRVSSRYSKESALTRLHEQLQASLGPSKQLAKSPKTSKEWRWNTEFEGQDAEVVCLLDGSSYAAVVSMTVRLLADW